MVELQTERLNLIPLSPAQLLLCLERPAQLEQQLEMPISRAIITERVQRAIRMKLAKMVHVEEARWPWYTYWLLVIRAGPFGAGLAGFKGCPNEDGEVEIGYGIDPAYQRQGYMTEAVQRLIAWAFEEPACLSVVAIDVARSNLASQRVLAKVGMEVYQESEDGMCFRVERGNTGSS